MSSYWQICVAEAFDEAKLSATPEQIKSIVETIEAAHDNYGMAHGYDCIPNPDRIEINRLGSELTKERGKVACEVCRGKGRLYSQGPYHCSDSQCWNCHGERKKSP